ncbi:transcription factor bHLH113-like [Iris pallida]|uniref:Transcription factor bHLH113-like n=1 Tax=Iris pallida TaxID=29817 RepID=A0AAX6HPI7_IRIPA|nr:transcription factor bHLH113-like [Iris pallida]
MMMVSSDQKRGSNTTRTSWSIVKGFALARSTGVVVATEKAPSHPRRRRTSWGRVAALQQLVSPFGKTDTASVLQEASGYIKFLHAQLQVLSAPYLRMGPDSNLEREHSSLRSRGLCLMPISSTIKVARSNGADLWAPANAVSKGP